MRFIFGGLYTFLFFAYVITGIFVVFHLLRYSLNRRLAFAGAILFTSVFILLLFTNALIFFSLPLEQLLTFTPSSF